MSGPGHVYRAFDAFGALLYVGCSMNVGQRVAGHQAASAWWGEVATITVAHFPNRDEALAAESRAIAEEMPLHNIVGASATRTAADIREARERREALRLERTTYVPALPVQCGNCGRRPERLPKGVTLDRLICKACGFRDFSRKDAA